MNTLDKLLIGQTARIKALFINEEKKRRFFDLGILPGMSVTCLFVSPLGDPIAYDVCGSVLALRREDTSFIEVVYE